ncbi:hypothetical protein HDV06_001833, partial [Boothiomyces sp. JEL0866]
MKSFTAFLAFACVSAFGPNPSTTPTPTGTATVPPLPSGTYTVAEPKQTSQGHINNRGGNVMANGVNVYAIFYGAHSTGTQGIVKNFINGLGSSDWWTVVKSYTGSNGAINGQVTWAGSYQDNYSLGKTLKSGDLDKIIDNSVQANKWPKDSNGIYVVFVNNDVSEQSSNGAFCKDYCGYHGITGSGLKSSMIGDATRCP